MTNRSVQTVVSCILIIATAGDLLLVACQNTSFSFPDFNIGNANGLTMLGDAVYQNSSMFLNKRDYDYSLDVSPKYYSCGKFFHPEMVRMQDLSTGQVASFSTVFTFEFILTRAIDLDGKYVNSDGFAFLVATDNNTVVPDGGYYAAEILCVNKSVPGTRLFAVEVDTWLNEDDYDPSDSHIAVDVNSVFHLNGLYSNLCEGFQNVTYCGYFAGSPGPYTVWVDYDGQTQILEVRFYSGLGLIKPTVALIRTKLDLTKVLNESMYVGFSGSYGLYLEAHRILSWNFTSSGLSSAAASSPQALPPAPTPPAVAGSRNTVALISGILGACAAIVLVGIGILVFCYCRRRNRNRGGTESNLKLHLMGPRMFTYRELSKATKDFSESELIGSGGFGSVYKGTLSEPAGAVVAVKRCTRPDKPHAEEAFVAEATSISQIRHRNLVQLQGWCQEGGELLLVYDYMPNSSLSEWLFNSFPRAVQERNPGTLLSDVLTWDLRYNILAGVAAALAYLHEEWQQCVLHRDVKSSNVMLDVDFNPHLGDFGLARMIDHHKAEKTTAMAGTLGYMAPEMSYTGRATKETDVYSFGVLVLEVVCGRRPLTLDAVQINPEDVVLVDCAWRAHEAGDLLSVADPRLGTRDHIASLSALVSNNQLEAEPGHPVMPKPSSVKDVLRLGLLCCQLNPGKRPSMRLVKLVLQSGDFSALPPLPASKPPMPFAFADSEVFSANITSTSSSSSHPTY